MSNVEVKGLKETQAKMEQVVRDLKGGPMVGAMKKATLLVEREAKIRSPVDTGRLRASITPSVTQNPLQGIIGSNVFYAPYQELGTGRFAGRSRHWPPAAALETWARRHGIESGFVVARAIGMRGGLRPRRFLRGAVEANAEKIRDLLDAAVRLVVNK